MQFGKKHLSNFRGVFMRDSLPQSPPKRTECAVVNLDSTTGPGTHWVAYYKHGNSVHYFDPFGNLRPPNELLDYFRKYRIFYNHDVYQNYDDINCGHLCLEFLYNKCV